MGYEVPLLPASLIAGVDLTNSRWYVGALSTTSNNTVVLPTIKGSGGVGIIQQGMGVGENIPVEAKGISQVVYGGTIAAGDQLTNDANGAVITATLSTDAIIGTAFVAGVAGDIGTILLGAQINSKNVAYQTISIPVQLAQITAAGTVFSFVPNFAGTLVGIQFAVTTPTTTASKLATLSPKIGGNAVTGGNVALTSATTNALGDDVAGTSITAGGAFTASQAISIVASAVTAFSEGAGVLLLTVTH
jgi:hypothetical protein